MSYNDLTAGLYIADKGVSSNHSCQSSITGDLRSCGAVPSGENKLSSAPQPQGTQPANSRSESTTSQSTSTATIPLDLHTAATLPTGQKSDSGERMEEHPSSRCVGIDRSMPATEIGRRTIQMLSQFLRPPKVGAKYWEDMAEEMGFSYQREIKVFALAADPVDAVISAWSTKRGSNVGKLWDILEEIERSDVLSELPSFLAADCRRWRRRLEEENDPIQDPEVSGNFPMQTTTEELRGITLNDHPDSPPERFDAYVSFTEADLDFVQELRKQLELPPHNFKLCIDPRDLVPGGSYAVVTAEIIQNRCNKMLVILSPEFLNSASCDFQTKFAVSLEPGARRKRIIPILVKPCTPPTIIRHITMCDFTKKDLRPWLWDRLRKAMTL